MRWSKFLQRKDTSAGKDEDLSRAQDASALSEGLQDEHAFFVDWVNAEWAKFDGAPKSRGTLQQKADLLAAAIVVGSAIFTKSHAARGRNRAARREEFPTVSAVIQFVMDLLLYSTWRCASGVLDAEECREFCTIAMYGTFSRIIGESEDVSQKVAHVNQFVARFLRVKAAYDEMSWDSRNGGEVLLNAASLVDSDLGYQPNSTDSERVRMDLQTLMCDLQIRRLLLGRV